MRTGIKEMLDVSRYNKRGDVVGWSLTSRDAS